ncbi:aldolase/citrate lyase family protein, partial [Pseudomonas panipatensis]|uniref:aldolase/citrate lyase family protein n=1 Tax=Pseudomonas panipatensis TaxID=428992 RepID=UPI0035B19748
MSHEYSSVIWQWFSTVFASQLHELKVRLFPGTDTEQGAESVKHYGLGGRLVAREAHHLGLPRSVLITSGAAHVSADALWPLIESARGILNVSEIAACAGVERLTFGGLDLALDIGLSSGSDAALSIYDQVRLTLILHSRANDLQPPLDTVYPDFNDMNGLADTIRRGHDMGL